MILKPVERPSVLTGFLAVFLILKYQKDRDCSVLDPAKTGTVVWSLFSSVQSSLRFFYQSLRLDLETLVIKETTFPLY